MITLTQAELIRGTKVLLSDASLTIYPGNKIGLVGANGSGKSSLLSLISGQLSLDKGEIQVPNAWAIASVAQHTPALDTPVIEYVLDGDQEFRQLQAQLATAESLDDGNNIAILHDKLAAIGAYSIRARAATLLAGLGFADEDQQRAVKTFSGGWRMRLNLAQALLCRSDLLLLDEPTNHLDLDTLYWLEGWIKSYQGTLVLISHDRDFIDGVVDQIVHLEQQKLYAYPGNYSAFEHIRTERMSQQQQAFERQQKMRAHMQSFVDRFRAKATKAKQAQSRLKALERMPSLLPVKSDASFSMSFRQPDALPNPLVQMEQVSVGYPERLVLEKVALNLVPGARIGLLGRNGAGKSTLIKLLAGELSPITGKYQANPGLNIGYFAQHQIDYLSMQDSPLMHLTRIAQGETEQEMRDFLGSFGFHGDMALAQVGPFSGGEKARLVLALLVWQKPNLLLLDEPTNHLDLDMRHALTMALQTFEGAMVIVSHDRHLLRLSCDEYYLVDNGEVSAFDGTLDDYYQWLLDAAKTEKKQNSELKQSDNISVDKKQQKRQAAELRQKLSPLKKQQTKLEKDQQQLSAQLTQIESVLAEPAIYADKEKSRLTELLNERVTFTQQLEESELTWLELQEQIEQIEREFC